MSKSLLAASILILMAEILLADSHSVEKGDNLQAVLNLAQDGDTIILSANTFSANPMAFTDPLCGNCLDPKTEVKASYGFVIRNKSVVIIGIDRKVCKLVTSAGYGLYIENSPNVVLKHFTITGGKRDGDGNATDAAIVVRNSRVIIEEVDIRDNNNRHPDSAVVVGVGGVFGREGADITVRDCNIINCSWDGIALYRGATAMVTDCLIKDGRGAGIGVTWDATCVAYRNDISGYWKGIGAFGTAWVVARNNIVHDNLGWGLIATGQSYMDMSNNVVHHNGNCGIAPWSPESKGRIVNNIVSDNGWRDQWVCPCVGIWNNGDWAKWDFSHNIVWNNKAGNYEGIFDQSEFNGNLNIDPKIMPDSSYRLQFDSPALNAGDSTIYNPDGTVSHIGTYGGPQAKSLKSGNY
ncbi:MAG: right-handed parallel beta-helix repeat-containing protein [Candidatus Zixiibacteriota bacterium]